MSDGGGDWIRLEVGGRVMATSRTTLTSCPSSVLARMFRPEAALEPAAMSPEGNYRCRVVFKSWPVFYLLISNEGVSLNYRIDCDPDIFAVILNWLRHGQVLLPKNMTEQAVSVVAEYFGLTPLVELLSPPTPPNPQLRMHFPDILPLDVRGRKINVNRSFLTRYPNSYLAEMFSANSRYTPARLADGSYSIDADPECFMVIINFLQYDRVILPSFGGPTIEDIGFVANQLALGSEISLQLKRAEERVAEERLRLLSPARLPD